MPELEHVPPAPGSACHLSELIFGGLGLECAHEQSAIPSPSLLNFPSKEHAARLQPAMKEYQSADQPSCRTPPCTASFSSSDGSITSPPTRNSSCLDASSPIGVSCADLSVHQHMAVLPSPNAVARARLVGGRSCLSCGTHSTPKWRGPLGNLCNACGLAERKKRPKAKTLGKSASKTSSSPAAAKPASRPRIRGNAPPPKLSSAHSFSFPMALAYASPAPAHDYSSPTRMSPAPTCVADTGPPFLRQPRSVGSLGRVPRGGGHAAVPMVAPRHPGLGMVHAAPRVCATAPAHAPGRRASATRPPHGQAPPLCFNFRDRMASPAVGAPCDKASHRTLVDELADFDLGCDLGCDLFMSSDEIDRALRVKDDLCSAAGRDQPQHMLCPAPPACFAAPFDPMYGIPLVSTTAAASVGSGDSPPRSQMKQPHGQWGPLSAASDATAVSVFADTRHPGNSAAEQTEEFAPDDSDDAAILAARDRAIQASAAATALLQPQGDPRFRTPKRMCEYEFDPPARHSRARPDIPGAPGACHVGYLPVLEPIHEPGSQNTEGGFYVLADEQPPVRASELPPLEGSWCSTSDVCWETGGGAAEALAYAGFCVGASA